MTTISIKTLEKPYIDERLVIVKMIKLIQKEILKHQPTLNKTQRDILQNKVLSYKIQRGIVIEIQLIRDKYSKYFNFKGIIENLGNLTHIKYLHLENIPIDAIPESILDLPYLNQLTMKNCGIQEVALLKSIHDKEKTIKISILHS